MEKYLLQIEFRYRDVSEDYASSESRKVTIGVYEDFDEACKHGNELLEKLEIRFARHKFPSGIEAKRERFSKNGGPFGGKKTLIANLAYLKTPFNFFAKITTLKYIAIDDVLAEVLAANKRQRDCEASDD